jgi:C4-dicarboxylate-specific signal transduction histidine kinase
MFWFAAAMAGVTTLAQRLTGERTLDQLKWELSSMLVCAAGGWAMRRPEALVRTVAMATLATFFLVTTPLVVIAQQGRSELMVLTALPVALSIIFIDRLRVVALVAIVGLTANTLALVALGWTTSDVLHGVAAMCALYGAGLLGAFEFSRLRTVERTHQESLHRATAVQLQSERLATLGKLAAGVAHEINNPLSYVAANLAHLEATEDARDPERREVWAETRVGVSRIVAIVADMKGLSRVAPAHGTQVVDLEPLLRQTARLATLRRGGLKVEVHLGERLPCCEVDELRLAQVLLNLAVNACDALDEACTISPTLHLAAAREAEFIVIDVDDNGPGVPAAVKLQLFTPFFTTKPVGVGTGLGLSLSREYLAESGGVISCEDSPLGGARFRIRLPVSRESSPPG